MKSYFAAALICTVSLLVTGCRRPLDELSAPLSELTLEVQTASWASIAAAQKVTAAEAVWAGMGDFFEGPPKQLLDLDRAKTKTLRWTG